MSIVGRDEISLVAGIEVMQREKGGIRDERGGEPTEEETLVGGVGRRRVAVVVLGAVVQHIPVA